ncbi:hypothetical protein FQZ97_965900 [compost metagenome]
MRLVRIAVSMPIKPVSTTNSDTTNNACSAVPIRLHSSCRATPGRIASSGSLRYSLISRCKLKVAILLLRPSMNAVMAAGCRSMVRACSALMRPAPRAGTPLCQSIWIASMPPRLICRVRSTGVPVRLSTPTTVNGLSSCLTRLIAATPWASTSLSPSL